MTTLSSNIFSEVRYYRRLSQQFQSHLIRFPDDWPKFQDLFNFTVDKIYKDIQQFERENMGRSEEKVYKLKRIFGKRYRRYFLFGEFIKWSYDKPFGYSGDFKIIDDIYQNKPRTSGFERLWDNYFQRLSVCNAVRQRKEDFKDILIDFVRYRKRHNISVMNLACGPAREIKELLESEHKDLFSKVIFDCYDLDLNAIEYARKLLNKFDNINFFQKNAIRIALRRNVKTEIPSEYDLIYSTGLFDYFDERISTRLVANLKNILKKDGLMIIANMSDKYSNSSAGWMEWVAEWNLIYRTESQFKKIFLNASFPKENLMMKLQKGKVVQYCFAKK